MNTPLEIIRRLAVALPSIFIGITSGHATTLVTSPDASSAVRAAADELASIMKRVYPKDDLGQVGEVPERGDYIYIGAADADPRARSLAAGRLHGAESFSVFVTNDGPRRIGAIIGFDARGTAYGTAALLKSLGCGFYISGDALPPAREGRFRMEEWDFSDHPMVKERIVFNWHNFLSGCSTWNLGDWNQWTRNAALAGFNGIMVHAYGNNPMAAFSFMGREKPVGFLSTTIKGRDWSTPHVNDVRRLWGGAVFTGPVFGPDAGMVPDEERVDAARSLMGRVFSYARDRGMDVYFAVDIDTPTANPPELVARLPEHARFQVRFPTRENPGQTVVLPNPETPEGYLYWKAQVDALMQHYPQITCMVPWFRAGGTPWTEFKREEMPQSWQREFDQAVANEPASAGLKWSHNIFAMAKTVGAFRKALDEGGHRSVRLATGSWRFDFVPAADRFMPADIALMPLDYEVLHERSQLRDDASRAVIRSAGPRRPMVPVVWAHHDDGHYLGRPYTPFGTFHSRLSDAKASGFGIIHWTTRPLDIYFESLTRQAWSSTRDEAIEATCANMAARLFGPEAQASGARYLSRWITEAPRFGRETSDWVIDRRLDDATEVERGCHERMAILDGVTPRADAWRSHLMYFRNFEKFTVSFHEAHGIYQRSRDEWAKGRIAEAKDLMSRCHPEPVIEAFARSCASGGLTRGEQGLIVGLNLRWLTHIIGHRQALGLEPVLINFAPTQHDPLAQAAGKFTFHFDSTRRVWQCLGPVETGATSFVAPATVTVEGIADSRFSPEICQTGIEIAHPIRLALGPMMALAKRDLGPAPKLLSGDYDLTLAFVRPADGDATATIAMNAAPAITVTIPSSANGCMVEQKTLPVTVGTDGHAVVTITPMDGRPRLCAAIIDPR